ncbi:MAG: hypothetical protein R3263_07480 [Myxococcota bacterium]|nr:hypothetical protein [Myxococcota bacterium]
MHAVLRALAVGYAAGSLGALANSLFVVALADAGVLRALGVAMAPQLAPSWLQPRLVWGGLFGLGLALPWPAGRWVRRGLLLSLVPTLVQLLVIFPWRAGQGMLGLELGAATPLVVLVVNAVWGVVASGAARAARS